VRWVSPDPALLDIRTGASGVLSVYRYSAWNPIRFIDPDGWEEKDSGLSFWAFAAGYVYGAVQAMAPGAALIPGAFDDKRSFKLGRGSGILAMGAAQTVVGLIEMIGGGAGTGAGIITSETGVGALLIPAGMSVAAAGAVTTTAGVSNVAIGWRVLSQAMSQNGSGSGDESAIGNGPTPQQAAAPEPARPSLSATKEALAKVHAKVGKLPKGEPGKSGSPQAGTPEKGYRLDPAHPDAPPGSPETKPHINWWDYSQGKRGRGGASGAIPIETGSE
jgi:hypothetical protein